jgi:hypothetical protein
MFEFLRRRVKTRLAARPDIVFFKPASARACTASRTPPRDPATEPADHRPPTPDGNPADAGVAEEKISPTVIAEQVAAGLTPFLEHQNRHLVEQVIRQLADGQNAATDSIKTHAEKTEAELGQRIEKQLRGAQKQLDRQVGELCDHITATVRKDAEGHWSLLEKKLGESCSAMAVRAAQHPVIDRLVAMFDRINDEGAFLNAWYRRNPDTAMNLGSRQLQERYDEAVRSFAAEVLLILRSLGVERIDGSAGQFDPQRQRVVAVETITRSDLDGHVARIIRAGFQWNGTPYRPEQVVVYKQEQKK